MTLHISNTGPVKTWSHCFRTSEGQFVPFHCELQLDCIFVFYIVLLISGSGGSKLSDHRFFNIFNEEMIFQ